MARSRGAALAALVVILGGVVYLLTRPATPRHARSGEPPATIETAASAVTEPAAAPSSAVTITARPVPSTSLVDPRPESEAAYMRELSRLARTDKPAALSLAKRGDEWYSDTGDTAEARKAMVVTLLVDLGSMEEARVLTRRFIAAYPSSPYRPLVQGVTGIHPRPHGPEGIEE
jgi:hypothetical protein